MAILYSPFLFTVRCGLAQPASGPWQTPPTRSRNKGEVKTEKELRLTSCVVVVAVGGRSPSDRRRRSILLRVLRRVSADGAGGA